MIFKKITNLMIKFTYFRSIFFLLTALIFLSSCEALKYKPVDAKEFPPEPEKRVKKNLEEGKGFRLFGNDEKGGNFDFASSNPLWRASLETIDFLPLTSANYSGGIIISDWYSGNSNDESIKISIRFLSNDVRSDSLKIIVHKKKCTNDQICQTKLLNNSKISQELRSTILTKAAELEKESKNKKKK